MKAKKSLGQNFLVDSSKVRDIIDSLVIDEDVKIMEIGPGKGYLTKELKRYDKELYAFEIDKDMMVYLDKLVDDKTHIIYGDFLNILLSEYFKSDDKVVVVANIPYYITTPIIERIISQNINVSSMTLMVQKEVAERLCARYGSSNYGYISVYLDYYFEREILFEVGRECFDPVPNVDSAVIRLSKRDKGYNVCNEELFFKLIKDAFRMKRKNLRNNLRDYDLEIISNVLSRYNLDLSNRAEELSTDIFIDIVNSL